MRTRPEELTDARIAAELAAGWGIDAPSVSYLPVGFGSHHWRGHGGGRDWFVTVDDLDARLRSADEPRDTASDRLGAALTTAAAVRDWGLSFVVAPVAAGEGAVVRRISSRFALALYPYVEGRTRAWGAYESLAERIAILDLLVALHRAPPETRTEARTDDFRIAHRDELERAIADAGRAWDSGPYAEPARALLARHTHALERLLAQHDRFGAEAREQPQRLVLTHGEPHPGNTILTDHGPMLVDWDTALLAPPERDVWVVAEGDSSVVGAYEATTRRQILPKMLEFYRLGWDLADIADFVALFRRPHGQTADSEKAWISLIDRLDLERRWPSMA